MARRRRFYARDTHGRFARVNGSRGVYKRRMSTRKKIAIAGAGAVAVGVAAYGGRELYRSGARKGYDVGKKHGLYEGKPLRGSKGRIRPNSEKKDTSQNPFARGKRPQRHGLQRARKGHSIATRARATRVAMHRVDQNFAQGRRRTEGFHARKRANTAARNSARAVNSLAKAQAKRAGQRAKRYNNAQTRSQMANRVNSGVASARRTGANLRTDASIAKGLAGQRVASAKKARTRRAGQASIRKLSKSR